MDPDHTEICLDGHHLRLEDIIRIAKTPPGGIQVSLSSEARQRVQRSRETLDRVLQQGFRIYGVNTGFGALANRAIPPDQIRRVQRNLILSHATQVGTPYPREVVRAAMLIRANSLAFGVSGVRPVLIETLLAMLNKGVVPVVPCQGSVGASGDLSPMAHIGWVMTQDPRPEVQKQEAWLVQRVTPGRPLEGAAREQALQISGEAEIFWQGQWRRVTGLEAMAWAGIPRIVLEAKEGLALINGTTVSTALTVLAWDHLQTLLDSAETIAALSFEALEGLLAALDDLPMRARPHPGQWESAQHLKAALQKSHLAHPPSETQGTSDPRETIGWIQDPYTLRCIPQVHGPIREVLAFTRDILEREINAATDNPLVFPEAPYPNPVISTGNFHAQYLALVLDLLAMAGSTLSTFSERRTYRLLTEYLNRGLPPFLVDPEGGQPGLQSGLMVVQYTAAALASENKALAHPASVDSIPTSAGQEDHVSMAPVAGRKTLQILQNTEAVLAIEALCAYQALRIRLQQQSLDVTALGKGTRPVFQRLQEVLGPLREDQPWSLWIQKLQELIRQGMLTSEHS